MTDDAAFTIFRVICILIMVGISVFFLLLEFCTPHWPRGRKTKGFLILFFVALLAGIIYFCRCAAVEATGSAFLSYGPFILAIWIILLFCSLSGIAKYGAGADLSSHDLRGDLAWGCAMATCGTTQFTTCVVMMSLTLDFPRYYDFEVFDVVLSTTAISVLVLCLLTVVVSVAAKRYAPIGISIVGAVFGLMFAAGLAPA